MATPETRSTVFISATGGSSPGKNNLLVLQDFSLNILELVQLQFHPVVPNLELSLFLPVWLVQPVKTPSNSNSPVP